MAEIIQSLDHYQAPTKTVAISDLMQGVKYEDGSSVAVSVNLSSVRENNKNTLAQMEKKINQESENKQ